MEHISELAQFYKALADETRLRLVRLLAQQQSGAAFCVSRLASELGVTPSAVSQHLRVLKGLGLVRRERRGQRIHYFLDREALCEHQEMARQTLQVESAIAND